LHIFCQQSKSVLNAGAIMGIHYDYKSTRGEKAMKKEAKKKARLEQRRAKKNGSIENSETKEEEMHDIGKPITLEDLTNPDKS
jgi:hypothetical protein|tara:strand:+ start:438 stop:686 length:249 start_codon:yes stop_codon:yes gene_type:complete